MTDHSNLNFHSLAEALRHTSLPGGRNLHFLRQVYRLVKRKQYLQTRGQEEVRRSAAELRPFISKCNRVLKALRRTQNELGRAEQLAEEVRPHPYSWVTLFHPASEALTNLVYAINQFRQRVVDQLHPRFRNKREVAKWELILKPYDYPLDRLGWKPAESWFLEELDSVISEYLGRGRKGISPSERHRLIQAIFSAGFQEHKDLKTIAVAVARGRKRKSQT